MTSCAKGHVVDKADTDNFAVILRPFYILNVNVHVYSLDIPVGSADCTIYTPGIGTHSFTVSSPLGRIQHLRTVLQL